MPAFPLWSAVAAPIDNHEWFKRLAASALRCPSPELERIAGPARCHGVIVSLGFNEGTATAPACASSRRPLGRIGMIICGENTNPLARFALMASVSGRGVYLIVDTARILA